MLIFSELSSNIPFFGVIFALILLLGLYEIGERILNNRTITHIRNESFKKYHLNDDCRLVTDKDIVYKNGYLELFPRFLRKPLMKLRVDRCVGGNIKKNRLDLTKMKYDFTRDRINLIVHHSTF